MIGRYCYYKGNTHIVVGMKDNTVTILDPLKGNYKVTVLKGNVLLRPEQAVTIEYRGKQYLVTHKLLIISLQTGRVMKWSSQDPMRENILQLYKIRSDLHE